MGNIKIALLCLTMCTMFLWTKGTQPRSISLPEGKVEYSKDGSYGYVPDSLVPKLNRFELMTRESIDVNSCKGVCGDETEYNIIQLSNNTRRDSCSNSFNG